MFPTQYIHFASSAIFGALAYLIIMRHPRSMVHRILALAMALLGLESIFIGLSVGTMDSRRILLWQHWRWAVASFLPGAWITFGLVFGQRDSLTTLKKWRWWILAVFLTYPVLTNPLMGTFFKEPAVLVSPGKWYLPLGLNGYIFSILFVLALLVILVLLERVLRSSRGIKRWQIKFLTLGIVSYFAARLFTTSMTILFRSQNLNLEAVNAATLILAGILITVSFLRTRVLPEDIYLSGKMIQNSVTVILAGLYFLAIGIFATVIGSGRDGVPFEVFAFVVFLSFIGLMLVLLSDRLRQSMRRFVSRHFQRSLYDYRHTWETFTQRTSTLMDARNLCDEAAKLISEIIEVLSVNIWLIDESDKRWQLYGSTAHSDTTYSDLDQVWKGLEWITERTRTEEILLDIKDIQNEVSKDDHASLEDQWEKFEKLRMRYFLPLQTGENLLGIIALGDKVRNAPLTLEEHDLLRTIAGQLAGNILNIRLTEHLQQAKEMEALQTFSAFFVHDLKNLSSKLSLMLQNFPGHIDNPDFREDSLRLISQSVDQINTLTGRISMVKDKLELNPVKVNINETVKSTLTDINGVIISTITTDLAATQPDVIIDPEQITIVLTNLIFNAHEALGDGGKIRIRTEEQDGWIIISVCDDGCGMTRDYIQNSLFRPFHSTKENGLGIGLYHCKTLVEAHHGRIEVKSREGEGSTFLVYLPNGK